MTPTTYRFTTFQEAVDAIPSDKIREAFEEMGKTFSVAKQMAEVTYDLAVDLAKADGKELPQRTGHVIELPAVIEWIDDGKGECIADISGLCRIEIKRDGIAGEYKQEDEKTE